MNRVIKFRVWDGVDYMSSGFSLNDLIRGRIQFTEDTSVMQFTGLLDSKGKEIYEGDVVECYSYESETLGKQDRTVHEVKWYGGDGYPVFDLEGYDSGESNGLSALANDVEGWQYEVIGNIYENPELIQSL